jgi:hypothetical protein
MADLSEAERWLLSICFCHACRDALGEADLDPSELANKVRQALSGPVISIESALGDELALSVATFRAGRSSLLRTELTARAHSVRPDATVSVHASSSPWATGSFPALGNTANVAELTTVVANCWNEAAADRELSRMKELLGQRTNLGAYVRADRVAGGPSETIERYGNLGVNELHLYHLGLFNRASLEVARELVSACHRAEGDATYDRGHD